MIVHHMRFSKEVEKVFYDANYFSILRNPVIMFESLFNYMKTVAPQFNKAQTLGKRLIHTFKTSRASSTIRRHQSALQILQTKIRNSAGMRLFVWV